MWPRTLKESEPLVNAQTPPVESLEKNEKSEGNDKPSFHPTTQDGVVNVLAPLSALASDFSVDKKVDPNLSEEKCDNSTLQNSPLVVDDSRIPFCDELVRFPTVEDEDVNSEQLSPLIALAVQEKRESDELVNPCNLEECPRVGGIPNTTLAGSYSAILDQNGAGDNRNEAGQSLPAVAVLSTLELSSVATHSDSEDVTESPNREEYIGVDEPHTPKNRVSLPKLSNIALEQKERTTSQGSVPPPAMVISSPTLQPLGAEEVIDLVDFPNQARKSRVHGQHIFNLALPKIESLDQGAKEFHSTCTSMRRKSVHGYVQDRG